MSKAFRNAPRRAASSESLYSLTEFERDFPDDAACLDWLVSRLYPEGIYCPTCKATTKHHREKARPSYACQNCGHHEHPMKGTIFEDSATSLKLWFYAIYLMSATRCGISAKQLERELGVTYKTAWRMFHKVRSLLANGSAPEPLSGPVEMDETYIGGRRRGTKRGRPGRDSHKAAVFGMVERGGKVVAVTVPNVKRASLMPHIEAHILPKSLVYTDDFQSYDTLGSKGDTHRRINHSEKIYVAGDVHINTIEGFWSLLKRGIGGVYRSVSTKHLQAYLDEYSFRYSHRRDPRGMFEAIVSRVEKASASG